MFETDRLQSGDVVRLKVGGPRMVLDHQYGHDRWVCIYLDSAGTPKAAEVHTSSLVLEEESKRSDGEFAHFFSNGVDGLPDGPISRFRYACKDYSFHDGAWHYRSAWGGGEFLPLPQPKPAE